MAWRFPWGSRNDPAPSSANPVRVQAEAATFVSLDDPRIRDFVQSGLESLSGQKVTVETALRNPAMFRAFSLIANSMGMLPFHIIDNETKEKAVDHPLYRILHREPNNWQTAFDFRSLMELRRLAYGDAYALVVRSRQLRTNREEIVRLIPLNSERMQAIQQDDFSIEYHYQPAKGARRVYQAHDIFHLRGLSLNGVNGLSLVKQARDAIGLALAAEMAAGRLYKNGAFVDGYLKATGGLSDEAFERLQTSWNDRYSGAENAGKTPLLEEGTEYATVGSSARDAQLIELRKMQVEEVARVTGIPRPLLMVDETSWGTGILALGQFLVQYALNPSFEAWQQSVERTLLTGDDKGRYSAKYNPAALLRGSPTEQANFFGKALGGPGARGWMTPNEVRRLNDLPDDPDPVSNTISQGAPAKPETDDSKGGDDAPTDPASVR